MEEEGDSAYVECGECGHSIEDHTVSGCHATAETCVCPVRWTPEDIERARRDAGLERLYGRGIY